MHEKVFSITMKDLVRQTFHSGGHGGQNVNKVETGVRLIHEPSGARAESTEHRTQGQNERTAFKRLAKHPMMTFWIHSRLRDVAKRKTVEQEVAEMMADKYLLVEVKDEHGRWVEQSP